MPANTAPAFDLRSDSGRQVLLRGAALDAGHDVLPCGIASVGIPVTPVAMMST